MKYKKHIFVCTNQRAPGQRKSCGEACGMELVHEFKKELKARGMEKEYRAQRTGCLDICEHGPSVVVYPDAVFYGGVTVNDVKEIVEKHIAGNEVVSRLKLDFSTTADV